MIFPTAPANIRDTDIINNLGAFSLTDLYSQYPISGAIIKRNKERA